MTGEIRDGSSSSCQCGWSAVLGQTLLQASREGDLIHPSLMASHEVGTVPLSRVRKLRHRAAKGLAPSPKAKTLENRNPDPRRMVPESTFWATGLKALKNSQAVFGGAWGEGVGLPSPSWPLILSLPVPPPFAEQEGSPPGTILKALQPLHLPPKAFICSRMDGDPRIRGNCTSNAFRGREGNTKLHRVAERSLFSWAAPKPCHPRAPRRPAGSTSWQNPAQLRGSGDAHGRRPQGLR